MPFKSEAQRRYFHAAAARGEIPKKTVKHWEEATGGKKLPARVKKVEKSAAQIIMDAQREELLYLLEKDAGMFRFLGDKLLEAGQFAAAGARKGKELSPAGRKAFGGPGKQTVEALQEWVAKQKGKSYRDPRTQQITLSQKSQRPGLATAVEKRPILPSPKKVDKSKAIWRDALSSVAGYAPA